jgi:alpha-galactosidase
MTAIVTTVLRKYPNIKFIGLCHEIASLGRYLPPILGTSFENLDLYAAGLNHFSILVTAAYRDSGLDAYPDILEKAPAFFEKEPGYSDVLDYVKSFGIVPHTEGSSYNRNMLDGRRSRKSWADRTLFHEIIKNYHVLPTTTDSHLGEYISWAHEIADHRGIKDFYALYRMMLQNPDPKIELKTYERVVPILEGLLGAVPAYQEPAVNILNAGLLPELPSFIAVEVPAYVSRAKIEGIPCLQYPKGFAALLLNYSGVYDLTAEAVLTGKRDYVIQAVLANPIVSTCRNIPELVDMMIERQKEWLSYIT